MRGVIEREREIRSVIYIYRERDEKHDRERERDEKHERER